MTHIRIKGEQLKGAVVASPSLATIPLSAETRSEDE